MAPFWSGRDDKGELGNPGMHNTGGYITDTEFSMCTSIVLNQKRYVLDPHTCLDLSLCSNIRYTDKGSYQTITAKMDSCPISDNVHKYITERKLYKAMPLTSTSWLDSWYSKHEATKTKKTNNLSLSDWRKQNNEYWDEVDWAGTYDYDQGTYTLDNPAVYDPSSDNPFENGDLDRQMQAIVDQLNSLAVWKIKDIEAITPEQVEVLKAINEHLLLLFESISYCSGFEIALIDALSYAFNLETSRQITDIIQQLEF